MKRLCTICFFLFGLTGFVAFGENVQIPTVNFTIRQGMSSNYVTDITQDKEGFIWFATEYGLNRFDGNQLTAYFKEDGEEAASLNSNDIYRIAADTLHDKIWIGTRFDGINVFDCKTQTFSSFQYQPGEADGVSSNAITDILVTRKGEVWIATADKGILIYNARGNCFAHYGQKEWPQLASDCITCLSESPNGDIYIGHKAEGITVFTPQSHTFRRYSAQPEAHDALPSNHVNAIDATMGAKIWIGTDKGLSLLDPMTGTVRHFGDVPGIYPKMGREILCVYSDCEGRIWAGSRENLCYFSSKDVDKILSGEMDVKHMYVQDLLTGVTNPSVYCVFEDSFHNLWIGSHGGGGSFISHRKPFFQSWRSEKIPGVMNGLNDKEIISICVANDSSVWLGTDGGGINVYKAGKKQCMFSSSTGEVSSLAYRASLKDSDGNLWFGSSYGKFIDIYKWQEKKFIRYPLQNNAMSVYVFYEDDRRNVWIGTDRGFEVYNLDAEDRVPVNHDIGCLRGNIIYAIAQSPNDDIWIGMQEHGIVICNPTTRNKVQTLLPGHTVNQLFRDSHGRMWAATDEGLFAFSGKGFRDCRKWSKKDGLPSSTVCAITEDNEGGIWISSYYGISYYDEEQGRFFNYDNSVGVLTGNYLNGSVAKGKDGTLYFGCLNGVCYFNPSIKSVDVKVPPVVFTQFKIYVQSRSTPDVSERSVPMPKRKIELEHGQNTFSISFSVLDKALSGQVEYAYRLEGLNEAWINNGTDNEVTFRNVPYGNYKLQVKARYKNLSWQTSESVLNVKINPPFWLSWWAKSAYLLLVFSFVLYLSYVYQRHLIKRKTRILEKENERKRQELNEERLTFFESITHELRTPLTLILGPLEDLQCELKISSEQQKKFSLIHKNVIRLLNLIKQILELRKTDVGTKKLHVIYDNVAPTIKEIGLRYKELNKKEAVTFSIETEDIQLYFDKEVLMMIVDNLLSNAFKYTQQGNITLSLRQVTENGISYAEIEVADTGIGIPEKDLPHLFERYYQAAGRKNMPGFGIGLALVKNLTDLHEGTVWAASKPGEGSSFRVRLIIGNSYPEAVHLTVPSQEMETGNLNKLIILVVEDEDDIREYIASSLSDSYKVITASNGKEGIEMAHTAIPDIVISDVIMPLIDGFELCRLIKSDVSTSHIPVILLTAKDSLQDKQEGYETGADSYITKPFSVSLLKTRVINLLETRKKIAASISSDISLKHVVLTTSLNKIDSEFMEKLTAIIERNMMEEKIDIPTIAQELSMSYSSLYRKIKAITGLSAGELIRKLKIRKAEQLLLSGKYNISEIAHQVGISSMSHFRECFKEEYGMSPTEYIRKIKNDEAASI